ncbi:MAG: SUMF1/EgtB/PvdO family nonheme iron enzyme [Cyanobacteria bacterium J06635_15]
MSNRLYKGAPADGSAWIASDEDALRLLRGGSWSDDPDYCRSAHRFRLTRGSRYNVIGFRVVCASSWTL